MARYSGDESLLTGAESGPFPYEGGSALWLFLIIAGPGHLQPHYGSGVF